MMCYRISKSEKILFLGKKNRQGVGSDLKIGKICAKIHKIGKIKAIFGLGMTPI